MFLATSTFLACCLRIHGSLSQRRHRRDNEPFDMSGRNVRRPRSCRRLARSQQHAAVCLHAKRTPITKSSSMHRTTTNKRQQQKRNLTHGTTRHDETADEKTHRAASRESERRATCMACTNASGDGARSINASSTALAALPFRIKVSRFEAHCIMLRFVAKRISSYRAVAGQLVMIRQIKRE